MHFDVTVDNEGKVKIEELAKALGKTGDEAEKAGKKGKKGLSKLGKAASKTARMVGKIVGKLALVAVAAAAAATAGFGFMLRQGIQMNATLEAIETQFQVIYQDVERAARAMKELVLFSASTPFQLAEIADAAKTLEAFGIGGSAFLRMVGDASAAAQRPIQEVAMTFGRIKSGAFGEAFMRLAEMGLVTREMLEMEGLIFNKGGSYLGTAEDAIAAVQRIVNTRFAGMMEKLSATWNGKVSTMLDNWKLLAAELTKPIFDILKPRIDQLTAIFQKWKDDGSALSLGRKLAVYVDIAAEAVLNFIEDLPTLVRWIIRIARTAALIYTSIKTVFDKAKNVTSAYFNYALANFELLAIKIETKMSNIFGGEMSEAEGWAIASAKTFLSAAEKGLDDALAEPGLRDTWAEGMTKIMKDFEDPKSFVLDLSTSGDLDGGPGLDADPIDTDERFAREQQLQMDLATLHETYTEEMSALYGAYWEGMGQIAKEGFSDVIVAELLESGTEIKQILDNIWQGMKYSFVKMTVDMGIAWAVSRIKMAFAEKALKKAALADQVEMTAAAVIASTAKTSALAGEAAAGYAAAHAYIPFAGQGIAAGYTIAMLGTIAGAKTAALAFREGGYNPGLVPRGGAGVEDDVNVRVSGGEYIFDERSTSRIGPGNLDNLRTGILPDSGGGGGGLDLTINNYGGDELDEEEVEELLVPLLERLGGRGRLSLNFG